MLAGFGAHLYITRVRRIHADTINAYIDDARLNSRAHRDIYYSVLLNSRYWRYWNKLKNSFMDVRLERVKGKQKDALIIIKAPEFVSIVAHYEKRRNYYQFVGLVDEFSDLQDVQVMPLSEHGGGLILARDHKPPNSRESAERVYISAYIWEDNRFKCVLNLLEAYEVVRNELWDQKKPADKCRWLRVKERADVIWENSKSPVIHVLSRQAFWVSRSVDQPRLPAADDFELIKTRNVLEDYLWSAKWTHFILFEGIDTKNAEPVAVIEDLSDGPVGLIGPTTGAAKYRVLYIDGTIETVDKERIKPGVQIKGTRVL
jgi:hypothetical protein